MFSHMLNSKCSLHFSDIIVIGLLFRERNLKQKGPKYVSEELSNKSGRIKAVRTKTSGSATDDRDGELVSGKWARKAILQ